MKKLIIILALFLFIPVVNAEETADDWMVGSVWNGSRVTKTYDSLQDPQYIGYTALTNGQPAKIYLGLTKFSYDRTILQKSMRKSWFYNVEVCSTKPIPTNYGIAYSGQGQVITAYDMQVGGTCTLGGNLTGTLYTVPIAVKYNSSQIDNESTEWVSNIVVDVGGSINYNGNGTYAVTNISVQEYTEEIIAAYKQQQQNNTIINQNSTIINQNQTEINQNQTIIDQNNATNNKLDSIDDTMNDSSVDNPSGKFNEFESFLPENGVITQLITLPISLFQKVLNSINGSCSEYNLGNLLGTDLKLPCINISNYIGTTIWNVIDVLFSGFFVLVISKKMIKTFNSFSSMEEGDVLD